MEGRHPRAPAAHKRWGGCSRHDDRVLRGLARSILGSRSDRRVPLTTPVQSRRIQDRPSGESAANGTLWYHSR